MSYGLEYVDRRIAAEAAADARAAFIRRTYGHLAGAILAFTLIETLLVQLVPSDVILGMFSGRFAWLICLGAFMGVAYVADRWARSDTSVGMQYLGLGLYVVAEAVIFLPLLYVAAHFAAPDVIPKAGLLTLTIFGGLTVAAFVTRQDFSYLRTILSVGGFVALGIIVVSLFMGTGLGLWFSAAMVVLACGFILYDTSNILHHYRTDQHVAASLALFASVALLFYYILMLLLSTSRRN
jgi:FtsH-binding integral membrane protein